MRDTEMQDTIHSDRMLIPGTYNDKTMIYSMQDCII